MPTDYHAKHWANEPGETQAGQECLIERILRPVHCDHSVEQLFVLRWELR